MRRGETSWLGAVRSGLDLWEMACLPLGVYLLCVVGVVSGRPFGWQPRFLWVPAGIGASGVSALDGLKALNGIAD